MPIVRIVDKYGEVVEEKELQDFQIDVYRQAGYNITTLADAVVTIPADIQQILTGIENGDYTVPQVFLDVEVVNIKNGNITPDRFRRQWQEGLNSGIIKSTIGTQIQSYTYSTPYGQFETQATNEQEAFQAQQEFVQEKQREAYEAQQEEIARQQEELRVQQEQQPPLEFSPIPTVPTVEALEAENDMSVNDSMVSQSIGGFEIFNNRITGKIIFIAENTFNPNWYGKPVVSLLQIKDMNNVTIAMKTNNLTFTDTERDETITFDESVEYHKKVIVESYVWTSVTDPIPMSTKKVLEVVERKKTVTDPETGEPTQVTTTTTTEKTKREDWLGKATGIFAGLFGVSLLLTGARKL